MKVKVPAMTIDEKLIFTDARQNRFTSSMVLNVDKNQVVLNQLCMGRLAKYSQSGFTLISVLFIMMIISIMAAGSMNLGHVSEKSAGNAIQRSRAFQAADGGAAIAENSLKDRLGVRIFADAAASEGVFSSGAYTPKWWRDPDFTGDITVDPGTIIGVAHLPRHIVEEVGQYATDGGTGIVGLDLGSAAYGSRSRSGREVVLYRVESHGSGSLNNIKSVIETVYLSSF